MKQETEDKIFSSLVSTFGQNGAVAVWNSGLRVWAFFKILGVYLSLPFMFFKFYRQVSARTGQGKETSKEDSPS